MLNRHYLLMIAGLLISSNISASDFCSGFERGYITGYKQVTGSKLDPHTPLCPTQPIKRPSDPHSNFEHGYFIGLQRGITSLPGKLLDEKPPREEF